MIPVKCRLHLIPRIPASRRNGHWQQWAGVDVEQLHCVVQAGVGGQDWVHAFFPDTKGHDRGHKETPGEAGIIHQALINRMHLTGQVSTQQQGGQEVLG